MSLGINDDISFDLDFKNSNNALCCLGVDFTSTERFLKRRYRQSVIKKNINRFMNKRKYESYKSKCEVIKQFPSFFTGKNQLMLKKVSSSSGEGLITIDELIAKCGSSTECNVFLKMDIEGAEYEIIPDIVHNQKRISCIAAEFHNLDSEPGKFNEAIRLLSENFYPVHIHGNNHGGYCNINDFPHTIELTLINKELVDGIVKKTTCSYPISDLDYPCTSKNPDYQLIFE